MAKIDEHRVLSGSADTILRLWDLDTGAEIRRFEGHWASVEGVVRIVRINEHRGLSISGDILLGSDITLRCYGTSTPAQSPNVSRVN